jgi:cytochrome c oxidase assembly protein subunit 15
VQFLTGLSNVVLQWPLALAVAHNGGAAVLVALLVTFNFRLARAQRAGAAG